MIETSKDQEFKADKGKLLAAIPFEDFPDALRELFGVCTFGAQKYSRSSWRKVKDKEIRYNDARARHFASSFREDLDEESGYHHLAHEAWNCLALLQLKLEENKSKNFNNGDWRWLQGLDGRWYRAERGPGEPNIE